MILSANFRIKDKGRIDEVKTQGKLLQSENFGVSYLINNLNDSPRFAFVISTKISKLAVHRNRINRSLHEGVRGALGYIPKFYDFVFLAKRSIASKSTEEIIKEVNKFFSNIKI